MQEIINNIRQWHHDRNLIEGSTDKDQCLKLMQELGELSDSICKSQDRKDDIGDMLVVLTNIAERNGHDMVNLLNVAVRDIENSTPVEGVDDKDQCLRLMKELGNLSDSICKGRDHKYDIVNILVVLLDIAERNGYTVTECLNVAWQDIKDRKGRMVDGIFVKEADL
jgi:NTP pyrophosphatase (non-canonical NTP hydrolase)